MDSGKRPNTRRGQEDCGNAGNEARNEPPEARCAPRISSKIEHRHANILCHSQVPCPEARRTKDSCGEECGNSGCGPQGCGTNGCGPGSCGSIGGHANGCPNGCGWRETNDAASSSSTSVDDSAGDGAQVDCAQVDCAQVDRAYTERAQARRGC
ncbi:hypothetical protein GCM10009655_02060 [Rhodoglobus aureus]|uniref:Uncharacterized protein n=1 Tax=Rhodoglobus aureus TaxID=191497 RepID=A0ABP4G0G9_9MICO